MNDLSLPLGSAAAIPPPARARFTGTASAFRRLIVRGALLQVITAGIYRFWLTTDARRFLWANTEIGGESLEYTGTAMELFLGFLIAIALLVPVYVLFFLGTLELGLVSQLSSFGAFLFLAVFGQYAYYRARRYRLTRTVYRGLRFHQSGSPFSYALRSLLWWILTLITLGLVYPWMAASLERYKLAHTHYGDLNGKFAGTGTSLFLRGIGLWLLAVVALLAIGGLGAYLAKLGVFPRPGQTRGLTPQVTAAVVAMGAAGLLLYVVAFVVYTGLQAITMKWWLAGLRFGPIAAATTLKKRRIIGAYGRLLGYALLALIVAGLLAGMAAGLTGVIAKANKDTMQVIGLSVTIPMYLALAVSIWVIYQMAIRLRIWRLCVDSITLTGFEAVQDVRADASLPSSAVGEGLADALGAGGI